MIEIDGSQGEGGGQVLRTALSMAALLGVPFVIRNIRAGRNNPGLAPQHLACVRAVAEICAAEVTGDELGSQEVSFEPGEIRAGTFEFDVAAEKPSAGSTSLVLQTVLPPLLFAPGPSEVTIRGGTHVAWSPTFEYLDCVFSSALHSLLSKTRAGVWLKLHRGGWYPRGGGMITAEIRPFVENSQSLQPICWTGSSDESPPMVVSVVSEQLPDHIAPRQIKGVEQVLGKLPRKLAPTARIKRLPGGPGTAVLVYYGGMGGYSALGERGKPAEQVGAEAAKQLLKFLDRGVAVDELLADQLLIYLAIAEGTSEFTTPEITQHLHTNAGVIKQFLPVEVEFVEGSGPALLVRVHGTTITPQEG